MRVCAVMMWYDEPVVDLVAYVSSLEGFVDRLVAVDGRWEGFDPENDYPASSIDQSLALIEACDIAGIDLTLHRPSAPWAGERTHRNYAMKLAVADADWVMPLDADERISYIGTYDRDLLENTTYDVAEVKFLTLEGPHVPFTQWEKPGQGVYLRKIFRGHPDLNFYNKHYWLWDGTQALWHPMPGLPFAKSVKLEMSVDHYTAQRRDERHAQKAAYVPMRDAADVERGYEV